MHITFLYNRIVTMSYGHPLTRQSLNGQMSNGANGTKNGVGASLDSQLNGGPPGGPLSGLKGIETTFLIYLYIFQ